MPSTTNARIRHTCGGAKFGQLTRGCPRCEALITDAAWVSDPAKAAKWERENHAPMLRHNPNGTVSIRRDWHPRSECTHECDATPTPSVAA